jgi:hypothetical protein
MLNMKERQVGEGKSAASDRSHGEQDRKEMRAGAEEQSQSVSDSVITRGSN